MGQLTSEVSSINAGPVLLSDAGDPGALQIKAAHSRNDHKLAFSPWEKKMRRETKVNVVI
jgi:hypothetical protein